LQGISGRYIFFIYHNLYLINQTPFFFHEEGELIQMGFEPNSQ